MAKAKDFYGKEVTTVIEEACREFGVSQEELDIEVLETGSAGIFGLCKKKAHIRAQIKKPVDTSRKKKVKPEPVQQEETALREKEVLSTAPEEEREASDTQSKKERKKPGR